MLTLVEFAEREHQYRSTAFNTVELTDTLTGRRCKWNAVIGIQSIYY